MIIEKKETSEEIFWESYKKFKNQATVIRSGFGMYGCYDYDKAEPFDKHHRESDLEHVAGMTWIIRMLNIFYPEIISDEMIDKYIFGAQFHELGELESGDIPDDGTRNNSKKDHEETKFIKNFFKNFPSQYSQKVTSLFDEFCHKTTYYGKTLYMIDKLEAILQGLVYETRNQKGTLTQKYEKYGTISEKDQQSSTETHSDGLVEIFANSFKITCHNYPNYNNFVKIINTAARLVRGSPLDFLETE